MLLLANFLITWSILSVLFSGWGMFALRACGVRVTSADRWVLAFWAGWGLMLAFLQVWHFAFAVNDAARAVVALVGAAGLVWNRADLLPVIVRAVKNHWLFMLLMVLFSLWMANRSTEFPINIWDTGLYHVQAVKWDSAYAIVPGLGNLHSRFGFGSTFFLYPALLNTGFWLDRTYHIANGLLFWVLFLQMLGSLYTVLRQRRLTMYHAFMLLFFPVCIWLIVYRPTNMTLTPSLSNDPSLFAIGIVTAAQLIYLVTYPQSERQESFLRVVLVVLLSAVAIAIKMNYLFLGALISLLALVLWLYRFTGYRPAQMLKPFVVLTLVAAAVFIPMFARTVMLTGYPLYPMKWFAFDVDWRIEPEHADLEWEFIRVFARDPENKGRASGEEGWDWLGIWTEATFRPRLIRTHLYFTVPLALAVFSNMALLAVRSIPPLRRRTKSVHPALWGLLAAGWIAMAFWFYSAPAVRFAGSALWIIGISASVILAEIIPVLNRRWFVYAFSGAVALLVLSPFLVPQSIKVWLPPGRIDGLYYLPEDEPIELFSVEPYTTDSGLELWKPMISNQCWFSALPCTPYPHPNLRLREEGNMAAGFILEIGEGDTPQRID